jgi:GntR family transcriptional regulator
MTNIRRDLGAPLHHQISVVLRSAIVSGRYGPGTYLPGENALMEMYNVSRATVRRALETLEAEGLIDRLPGKGTRVLDVALNVPMADHLSAIERANRDTTVEILEWTAAPAPYEAACALALPVGQPCLKIVRLRKDEATPLRHLTSYIPSDIGDVLVRDRLVRESLPAVLRDAGYPIERAEDEVGAALADPILAQALQLQVGDPLLEVTRTMYDPDRRPVAYQWSLIPPTRYRLRLLIHGSNHRPITSLADYGAFVPSDDPASFARSNESDDNV